MSFIELKQLCKSYYLSDGTEIPILKGINLNIQKGEFIALMGESGSGKSTLLNVIGCLHFLTSGKYILDGDDISNIKDDYILSFIRNQKIGFIFQQFYLLPNLTVLENVLFPTIYSSNQQDQKTQKALKLLTQLGLQDRIYYKPTELSGGQQQRTAIARSLINDPDIILADEPTGALDSKTSIEVMNLLKQFNKDGKTIIMVTHNPEMANYADKIIRLKDGKVLE